MESLTNHSTLETEHDRRQRIHNSQCYGTSCFSCGCHRDKGICCVYHSGSDKYKNELLLRIAVAQEKLANIRG